MKQGVDWDSRFRRCLVRKIEEKIVPLSNNNYSSVINLFVANMVIFLKINELPIFLLLIQKNFFIRC
jgi:hypothetical protein